ncbi:MAG: hypothetical protein ACYDHH_23605 [Solirubrobacteraceae bacterium]
MGDPQSRTLALGLLAGATLGALLLTVAELTTLFTISVASSHVAYQSVGTGTHDSYALIPVALLALLLAAAVLNRNAPTHRLALTSIAVLGVLVLVLALAHDLPDAQANGIVRIGGTLVFGKASPSAGLYMETLGAVVLIITGGCGLLLAGAPQPPRRPVPRRLGG